MKLHSEILKHYLTCRSPVDKEGYLYKKGEKTSSYLRRWFVLKGNLLFYQEQPGDRNPLGVIIVEGCSVELCDSQMQFAFCLAFDGPGFWTYQLSADDQRSQESWIKALLSASHGYLSALAGDLEKQYKVIVGQASFQASSLSGPDTKEGGPWVRDGQNCSTNRLPPALPVLTRPAPKRSHADWPKRNAFLVSVNEPHSASDLWPSIGSDLMEDFWPLHKHYGKEVKELMAERQRRQQKAEEVQEGDLVDLG